MKWINREKVKVESPDAVDRRLPLSTWRLTACARATLLAVEDNGLAAGANTVQDSNLRRRLACWPGLAKAFKISRSFCTKAIRAKFARAAVEMSCRETSPRSTPQQL